MAAIYGQLVKAQLENLAADIGSPPTGVIYFNTVSGLPKFYDGASWRTVVTLDSTQTLSGKTLLTPLVDDYAEINEESAPSTPASGKVRFYAKSGGGIYWMNSAGTEFAVGTGTTPNNTIYLEGGSGHGSTNTKIRRFTTIIRDTSSGAFTYATSAANGGSFTIATAGVYFFHFVDSRSTGGAETGVSVNSNQLTTSISTITSTHRVALSANNPFTGMNVAGALYLSTNDVLRAHTDGTADETSNIRVNFNLTKVS